jgi:hypothetical protein
VEQKLDDKFFLNFTEACGQPAPTFVESLKKIQFDNFCPDRFEFRDEIAQGATRSVAEGN